MAARAVWSYLVVAVAVALVPVVVLAGDRASRKATLAAENGEVVELFSAMEKGQVDVKLIPKDSTQSRVMIHNKTDKPLSIKLPEAFAGVPVLAQGGIGVGGGGGNQGVGGGMGGMGGGGMFNVAPEKVGQLKVATVCLDHGKDEPRPAMAYELKPLEQYTNKPGVKELCTMLGQGQVNQRSAQVAAWHLNNDMSLQELAAKQLRHADGSTEPYFSPLELRGGMQAAVVAQEQAKKNSDGSQSMSLSQN